MKRILPSFSWRCLILTAALLLTFGSRAWAHAFLDYALPEVGSVVNKSPSHILICFTSGLKYHGSWIKVFNAKGKEVDKKNSHSDPKDWCKLFVSVPKLPPGRYKVSWHADALDGHITEGTFKFTIK